MSSTDAFAQATAGANSTSSASGSNTNSSTPQQNAEASSVAQSNVAGDGLKCEWLDCGDRLPTAEKLYDHVCERHVGRKSTNNLNLTCGWGNCRTTTVKRDHITSHIRVHVPLKPHKCDFCQKAFKRPQDLKKHVKTHAEDPNFQASPEPNRLAHPGSGAGVFAGQSKHVADLQHLAATASGYYPDHHGMNNPNPVYSSYANGNAANPSAYHGPTAGHYQANYMTTLYPVNNNSMSEYEVRKKATFDALNEFFGDIKTRSVDAGVYHAVGQRLMHLQNLPTYAGAEYGGAAAVATASHAPLTNHYSLPMSNIRTKNDLQHIDQFLEQLQSTVYEHETQAAQAGVQQAGIHYQHAGLGLRATHSPPHANTAHQTAVTGHILPPITSTAADTPALTPASSVMSYNSPGSVHSATISPISRASNASMYPILPSVSGVSDASSGAIPSALASTFDADSRRRYSAGILQKARTEKASSPAESLPPIDRLGVRSPSLSNVDPALSGEDDAKPAEEPKESKTVEGKPESEDPDWITKVRVLESIRNIIKLRLENEVFEDDDDTDTIKAEGGAGADSPPETEAEREARSLYPVLRAVQEA